jgi:[acyl-carrier-protein] S-malonyltransferase
MKHILLTQGQGAQFVLMGKDFHDQFQIFRHTMEEAEDLTRSPIRSWIYEGTNEALSDTDKSQITMYTTTVGIYRVLKEICPMLEFSCGIGLSLGEYSALTVAECLDFSDGVRLVKKRGELMQACAMAHPGKMAAVLGLTVEQIAPHLVGTASMANLNTLLQTVISGSVEDIDLSIENLKKNGAKRVVLLDVVGAFHSPLMMDAYHAFKEIVDDTPFSTPKFEIIMNATAKPENDPKRIQDLLSKQLIQSVCFRESVVQLEEKGPFLELGPGTVVRGLVEKNIKAKIRSINTVKDLKEFEVCVFS